MIKRIMMLVIIFVILITPLIFARDYVYHYTYFSQEKDKTYYAYSNVSIVVSDSTFVKDGGYIQPFFNDGKYHKIYVYDKRQIKDFTLLFQSYTWDLINN